ncbi:DUF1476 domain-containing protein [Aureimonas psammosilenae]|uniref:DUF1476 domain-containing protein n=1 Tax=Aureimonas psammosilenae TaxID=2495496 RepID=UPI001F377420|nr:DUF1476 domain-containing protein [Aureimonas psammosilenae]
MFEERERDFENRYFHDQEMRFRIKARRNKLVGLWAADRLELRGEEAEAYAQDVIRATFQKTGDEDVVAKIKGDFERGQVGLSEAEIRKALAEQLPLAEKQILSE